MSTHSKRNSPVHSDPTTGPAFDGEGINCKKWVRNQAPRKILAIRLQALGDVVISLPYLKSLRHSFPDTGLDLLTRKEVATIPTRSGIFGRVFSLRGGRDYRRQHLSALLLLPVLLGCGYDVIIDLQRNSLSRWIRRFLRPAAWSEFDRFSSLPAGERYRLAIEALELGNGFSPLSLRNGSEIEYAALARKFGLPRDRNYVILNPAGFFPTRNWPLENYVAFANIWINNLDTETRFVFLGLNFIRNKGSFLEDRLQEHALNLIGRTSQWEAFSIAQYARLCLTEDSGLMHMAWVGGCPTLALFGSSRSDWSAPMGEHSLCMNSSDLDCGECMQASCRFGDVHCLTRYSPELVFQKALGLITPITPLKYAP